MGRADPGPEVKVHLGGQERTLRFDIVVLEDLEDEIGLNLLDLPEDPDELEKVLTRPKVISALVWAMLLHEDADLKRRDVGRWLRGPELLTVPGLAVGLVLRELSLAATEEASEEEDPPEAPPESA